MPVSTPVQSTSTKILLTEDQNYEEIVGMVRLYPKLSGSELNELENPVLNIKNGAFISLEFDLFQENFIPVTARYIHCQANWSPSNLADIRFLTSYNEFAINDFEYSANTKIPYVSYTAELPCPTLSGNYLVNVYRGYDARDILFTRRLLVVGGEVEIATQTKMSTSVGLRNTHQQIEFALDYSNLDASVNPLRDFYVIILQNHNWATSITGLQPTLMRQDQSYLEYHHFNQENNLSGGNEFRYFDLRSTDYRGQNVANIQKEDARIMAFISRDKSRRNTAYSQLNEDLNGAYFLDNRDPGDSENMSEYVWAYFQLEEDQVGGEVYVAGKFNNWKLDQNSLMTYDPASQSYRGKHLIRQGYYNYSYILKSGNLPPNFFEGDFFQTSNEYEIVVYLRDPLTNIDRIVGYKAFSSGR